VRTANQNETKRKRRKATPSTLIVANDPRPIAARRRASVFQVIGDSFEPEREQYDRIEETAGKHQDEIRDIDEGVQHVIVADTEREGYEVVPYREAELDCALLEHDADALRDSERMGLDIPPKH
jgi:hypothetical protein